MATDRIERIATDILTPGLRSTALPSPASCGQSAEWRNQGFVTRDSGATVPDSHGIPELRRDFLLNFMLPNDGGIVRGTIPPCQ